MKTANCLLFILHRRPQEARQVQVRVQDVDADTAREPEERGGGPDRQGDDDAGLVRDPRPMHLGSGSGQVAMNDDNDNDKDDDPRMTEEFSMMY